METRAMTLEQIASYGKTLRLEERFMAEKGDSCKPKMKKFRLSGCGVEPLPLSPSPLGMFADFRIASRYPDGFSAREGRGGKIAKIQGFIEDSILSAYQTEFAH